MAELTVAATVENLEKVTAFVSARLAQLNCPAKIRSQMGIAVDELFGTLSTMPIPPISAM